LEVSLRLVQTGKIVIEKGVATLLSLELVSALIVFCVVF